MVAVLLYRWEPNQKSKIKNQKSKIKNPPIPNHK
jgi:hypothetical protein